MNRVVKLTNYTAESMRPSAPARTHTGRDDRPEKYATDG